MASAGQAGTGWRGKGCSDAGGRSSLRGRPGHARRSRATRAGPHGPRRHRRHLRLHVNTRGRTGRGGPSAQPRAWPGRCSGRPPGSTRVGAPGRRASRDSGLPTLRGAFPDAEAAAAPLGEAAGARAGPPGSGLSAQAKGRPQGTYAFPTPSPPKFPF